MPSSRRRRQRLLRSRDLEQLQKVVRGGDQVPLSSHLLQAPQQETPQAWASLISPFTGTTIALRWA